MAFYENKKQNTILHKYSSQANHKDKEPQLDSPNLDVSN